MWNLPQQQWLHALCSREHVSRFWFLGHKTWGFRVYDEIEAKISKLFLQLCILFCLFEGL